MVMLTLLAVVFTVVAAPQEIDVELIVPFDTLTAPPAPMYAKYTLPDPVSLYMQKSLVDSPVVPRLVQLEPLLDVRYSMAVPLW
jgi:hypothetical protein